MKLSMINVARQLTKLQFKSKIIIQVHDELVFDVVFSEINDLKALVVKEMETVVDYLVPLTVDVQIGHNWLEIN